MREIKFRIRLENIKTKEVIVMYNSIFDAMNGIAFYEIDRTEWKLISYDEYTGIKDRNGKEIYEGDITRADGSGVIGKIVFYNGRFAWNDGACHWDLIDYSDIETEKHEIGDEVIGNIYEHPELIK